MQCEIVQVIFQGFPKEQFLQRLNENRTGSCFEPDHSKQSKHQHLEESKPPGHCPDLETEKENVGNPE